MVGGQRKRGCAECAEGGHVDEEEGGSEARASQGEARPGGDQRGQREAPHEESGHAIGDRDPGRERDREWQQRCAKPVHGVASGSFEDADERTEPLELGAPQATHSHEILDRSETIEGLARVEDPPREDGSDPGQPREIGERGVVEIEGRSRLLRRLTFRGARCPRRSFATGRPARRRLAAARTRRGRLHGGARTGSIRAVRGELPLELLEARGQLWMRGAPVDDRKTDTSSGDEQEQQCELLARVESHAPTMACPRTCR